MKKKIDFRKALFLTVVYVIVVLGALVCLFPLYWQIRSSLMTNTEIFIMPPRLFPVKVMWENYPKALSAFPFWDYLRNTMTILIPAFCGTVLTSILTAYAFARLNFPGRNIWFLLAIASMFLPGVVTMIPTYVMWGKLHLTNSLPADSTGVFGEGPLISFLLRQFFPWYSHEYGRCRAH